VSELGSAPVPEPTDADHRRGSGPLTIVYAARDEEHNNAAVVAELVRAG